MIPKTTRPFLTFCFSTLASIGGLQVSATAQSHTTGPIKVFFLSGQSNMQGHGFITEQVDGVETQGTLRHFVDNNPGYAFLRPGGSWVVRDDTWMWVRQGPVGTPQNDTYSTGNLTASFGAGTNNGPTSWAIGPEFGLGMKVGEYLDEQVVIVKMAWGGTSLFGDWRPPSAVAKRGGSVGLYYNIFHSTWDQAQVALATRYPGRELQVSGMGWLQGENDRFNDAATAEYADNLADLIHDMRTALGAPAMPFVIATTSDGTPPTEPYTAAGLRWLQIENSQIAMADRENVATVVTRPFYREAAVSPRNEAIHWNKNAESAYKIGEAMGEAMVTLLATPDTPDDTPPAPDPLGFASPPAAVNSTTITMTAETATDVNGVQYRFMETSGNPGGTSSDWQYSPTFTATDLTPNTTYTYTVEARDLSAARNTTTPSAPASATTPLPDTTPPTPDPMTFASVPAAVNAITVNMTATTAVDDNYPVEYFFEETSGNPGGTSSGWQSSPEYTDTGLKPGATYSYRVKARDTEATPNETAWSAGFSVTTPAVPAGTIAWSTPGDITGPADVSTAGTLFASYTGHNGNGNVTVNGVTFSEGRLPNAQSSGANIGTRVPDTGNAAYNTLLRSISWNYTGGKITLTGLTPGAEYEIQIWAADNNENPAGMRSLVLSHGTAFAVSVIHRPVSGAPGQFTTGTFTASGTIQEFPLASYNYYGTPDQLAAGASITNGLQVRLISGAETDTTPPTPDPSTWLNPPAASGPNSIVMTATTASDPSGVEYFFEETTGNPGGSDSGWQDSPTYTDTGLIPETTYSYTVRARDKSPAQNPTTPSAEASATTPAVPPPSTATTVWNVNFHNLINTSANFLGAAPENTTDSTWNRIGGSANSLPVTASALLTSTGEASPVTMDLNAANFGGAARTNTGGQTIPGGPVIFNGFIGGDLATSNLTLNGLDPARSYDLVIFSGWWWQNGDISLPVLQTIGSGLGERIFVSRYVHNNNTLNGQPFALREDTNPANVAAPSFAETTNWYRIKGLTPSAGGQLGFSIGAFGTSAGQRSNTAFNGFQLIGIATAQPNAYESWAGSGVPFDGDLNGDGVANGLAFLLNATGPNANALDKLATVSEDDDGLVLTFQTLTTTARGTAQLMLEYSTSLAPSSWTTVSVPGTAGDFTDGNVSFTLTGTGPLDVTATISAAASNNGKLFARLKATESTPEN
jgi:hypothetical protein